MFQDLLEQCLKPVIQDRPASAVEVYLRLQELGKASGILLLPPGAMDKLVAARQQQQETVTYQPAETRRVVWRRRVWVGVAALVVLALAIWGALALLGWPKPVATPAKETLRGIEIGDSRAALMAKMGQPADKTQHGVTRKENALERLGFVLKADDLGGEAALAGLDVLWWSNHQFGVVLDQDVVKAVVSWQPNATTGRGVKIGDTQVHLEQVYPEEPEFEKFHPGPSESAALANPNLWASSKPTAHSGPKWGKVYRYNRLGIGFEVLNDRVSAMALYPSQP